MRRVGQFALVGLSVLAATAAFAGKDLTTVNVVVNAIRAAGSAHSKLLGGSLYLALH